MKDVLAPLAAAFGDALEPLLDALRDADGFLALADELGFALDLDEAIDDFLDPDGPYGPFATLAQDVRTSVTSAQELAAQLRADPASLDVADALALIDGFRAIVTQLAALRSPTTAELPPILDVPELWDALTEELPDFLLAEYVAAYQPVLYGVLEVLGLARRLRIEPEAQLLRRPYVRRDIRWSAVAELLQDPGGHLRRTFRWDGAAQPGDAGTGFDHERLLTAFAALAAAARLRAELRPMSDHLYLEHYPPPHLPLTARPNELGLDVVRARNRATGASIRAGLVAAPVPDGGDTTEGIVLTNVTEGQIAAGTTIAPGWTIAVGGSASASHALTISVVPSGVTTTSTGTSPTDVSVLLTGAPIDSGVWTLVGSAEGTGLTLGGLQLELAFGDGPDGPHLSVRLALTDLRFAVRAGEADGLINDLMSAVDIAVGVSLEALYATSTGLSLAAIGGALGGPDGIVLDAPIEIDLGPVTLAGLQLSLAPSGGDLRARATTSLWADIGPFAALISDLGLAIDLVAAADGHGQLGPYDLDVRFQPPSGLALSIESEAVTGGGFLEVTESRYAGALIVKAIAVGISAITVIDTELPGDPEGWSFFAALSLEFPGIPLGFGFTLTGLGGLIALNRGFDEDALAAGLKTGAVDALLFPDDPVGDAAAIVAMIDDYFPPLAGNTVIGPMVQIGWGVPTPLLTAELGVIISLPEGKIGLLGTIAVLLPSPAAPLLSLRMDLLGTIDLPAGTLSMVASLYDSTLLGTIDLSGDMGTFLSVLDRPYFLLSVGGYNPGFQPPALVPSSLHDLRRMRASIQVAPTVSVRVTSYFALTSNTVQFGSEVVLEASVKIWPVTYTARGELGFHVFLRFSPFLIQADFEGSVGVYAGDSELLGVHLAAHLEGPEPWYASGSAGFRFLGVNVDFEFDVGSKAPTEPKPRVPLRNDVIAALQDRANWREVPPSSQLPSAITYLDDGTADDERLWIRPDHTVEVRQGAAPLNRTIDIVGQGLPEAGHERIEVTGAALGGDPGDHEIAQDWFAPAQFEQLGKSEKLVRASYESMDAGVRFASPELRTTAFATKLGRTVEVGYEESLYDPGVVPLAFAYPPDSLLRAARAGAGAHALRRQRPQRRGGAFQIADARWTLVDETTGAPADVALAEHGIGGDGGSQYVALTAARAISGVRAVPVATVTEEV